VARFEGHDAGDFLHRQLSADIAVLAPGQSSFACCCTPKGQVIGLLLVCRQTEGFLVAGSTGLLPLVLARLKIFVLRSRVEFGIETGLIAWGSEFTQAFTEREVFTPAELGLAYHFSAESNGADKPGAEFKAAEIKRKIAWLDLKTSEKYIPQMLGYDQIGAVSFSKGCYPGQEIVARARYLGKVKRRPVIVLTNEQLAPDPTQHVGLLRGETWIQGVVVDSVRTDQGTWLFIIAPIEPEGETTELEYAERRYRCATM
jgi:folate-binding protein YgfZ